MASLRERRNKDGILAGFYIRISLGRNKNGQLKEYTEPFKIKPEWTEKYARKKAQERAYELQALYDEGGELPFKKKIAEKKDKDAEQAKREKNNASNQENSKALNPSEFAAVFKKQVHSSLGINKNRTIREYCDYIINLKAEREVKHRTIVRYRELSNRICEYIGDLKVTELRPDILNLYYSELGKDGMNKLTGGGLSNKTIMEHHRFIHVVLENAVREGIIATNPADRVILPKLRKTEVNYFEPETIVAIRKALEEEPFKWKMITHIFLITGARRGEILGLKWEDIDFEKNTIHIRRSVLYAPDIGIYVDTPKTSNSDRIISIPSETSELLGEYREFMAAQRLKLGISDDKSGFIFTQVDGNVMHPDSVTDWMGKFSKKHNLPHINPHAFRHTMASILYANNVDSVSISKRLGHAKVSTTSDIYAHVFKHADEQNADILSNVLLKND